MNEITKERSCCKISLRSFKNDRQLFDCCLRYQKTTQIPPSIDAASSVVRFYNFSSVLFNATFVVLVTRIDFIVYIRFSFQNLK